MAVGAGVCKVALKAAYGANDKTEYHGLYKTAGDVIHEHIGAYSVKAGSRIKAQHQDSAYLSEFIDHVNGFSEV